MKTFFSPAGKCTSPPTGHAGRKGEPGISQVSVHYCWCKAHRGELPFQGLSSKMVATSRMQQHSQAPRDDRGGKLSRQFSGHDGKATDGKLRLYCPRLPPASTEGAVAPVLLSRVTARAQEADAWSLALKRLCTSGRVTGLSFLIPDLSLCAQV